MCAGGGSGNWNLHLRGVMLELLLLLIIALVVVVANVV